jgi:hypothetical protein
MGGFFQGFLKAYAVLSAYVVTLLLIVVASLFVSGALSRGKVQAAWQALRGTVPLPERPVEPKPADGVAERELILERRTQELQKLDERVSTRLALLRAEQETAERKRQDALAAAAAAKKAQEELAQGSSDAELAANVPILSRMEAPGIVAVLKTGEDARFVRYLRALRPGKAAEVLEAIRTDPQFEEEFRRVPQEAPPGTKSRADRLHDEMKKP